jgi:hypothetical protein
MRMNLLETHNSLLILHSHHFHLLLQLLRCLLDLNILQFFNLDSEHFQVIPHIHSRSIFISPNFFSNSCNWDFNWQSSVLRSSKWNGIVSALFPKLLILCLIHIITWWKVDSEFLPLSADFQFGCNQLRRCQQSSRLCWIAFQVPINRRHSTRTEIHTGEPFEFSRVRTHQANLKVFGDFGVKCYLIQRNYRRTGQTFSDISVVIFFLELLSYWGEQNRLRLPSHSKR